jgi:triosephosphate isomerase
MRPLIGTSWKMNLTSSEADRWFRTFVPLVEGLDDRDLFVLPPFPAIWVARERLRSTRVAWGAQDVHPDDAGPHTGDVSAPMLADLGCRYVEVGHSERRRDHGETPELIAAKVAAVLRSGMEVVLCTGEREVAPLETVVPALEADLERCLARLSADQLDRVIVAYEPVWAIGTGRTPTMDEIHEMHAAIREALRVSAGSGSSTIRILYGGSVKPENAAEILALPQVDGALIGGASLKAADFLRITRAASKR